MRTDDLGARLRKLETFRSLRVPPGAWTIIRVDGCGFSRLTAEHFHKPFDERCSQAMIAAAYALVERFQGVYAYTESDEISLLLPRTFALFERRIEKLISLTAAVASAAFTSESGILGTFDSRICIAATDTDVIDYFRWRQSDAARCALNGWCYWTLRGEGLSQATATAQLSGSTTATKHELLFARGIHFPHLPAWQRNGVGVSWETFEKEGFDPRTRLAVLAERRRLQVSTDLPIKQDYDEWLARMLTVACGDASA